MPEQDAVVAITSGVRDMQAVLNLVWDKLLPAMKAEPVAGRRRGPAQLEKKLAGLTVRVPAGAPTAALAKTVSRKWYDFPENDRGLQAVALDFGSASPALLVRTAGGETRTPIGLGSWTRSRDGFANGLDRFLSVPAHPLVAASGAWTAPDTFHGQDRRLRDAVLFDPEPAASTATGCCSTPSTTWPSVPRSCRRSSASGSARLRARAAGPRVDSTL